MLFRIKRCPLRLPINPVLPTGPGGGETLHPWKSRTVYHVAGVLARPVSVPVALKSPVSLSISLLSWGGAAEAPAPGGDGY